MRGRSPLLLGLAVVMGLVAMLAARSMLGGKKVTEQETREILVASRDFKEEEVLKQDMVKAIPMARSAIPPGAFATFKDVEDRWVKTAMLEGDVIIEKKLGIKGTPPGLVSNIPAGMRAFAVEVNEQSGVSGFILPGHHVDVVRYETSEKSKRGETILQNILVLAAGQTFTRPDEKAVQSRTVTLAVTPENVDNLVAAKAKGPMSLSLRGVNDHEIVKQPKPVVEEDQEEKAAKLKQDEERRLATLKHESEEQARRQKLEGELAMLKAAMSKKAAAPPPPPPRAPDPRPSRRVLIYRCDQRPQEHVVGGLARVGMASAADPSERGGPARRRSAGAINRAEPEEEDPGELAAPQ